MRVVKRVLFTVTLGIIFAPLATSGETSSQPVTVKLTPPVVQMGIFYGGAKVRVEGAVPPGSRVVVVVRGPEITEVFNRIGRVGPIWVNTGKVTISKVPSLLLVFSSGPICDCLCRREIDRCQCDLASLKRQIHIEPREKADDSVAEDFLKLKVRQGNYQMAGGSIHTGAPEQALVDTPSMAMAREAAQTPGPGVGTVPYTLEFAWPKSAAAGTYSVSVHACRNGEVEETAEVPLSVVEAGLPATIASLARERPATYGIISVFAAMLAGFGIDFVVSRLIKRRIAAR